MKKHPSLIIQEIVDRYGTELEFEFSYYIYVPRTIEDKRTTFTIPANELTAETIEDLCNSTPAGMELALNSRVVMRDSTVMHIPMIDLATKATGIIGRVLDVLPSNLSDAMIWFESGRSYHGYGTVLISQEDWTRLMGRFLLVNQPQVPPVVDPRWIGHRLISGYASLRWTKNTGHYLQQPELAKNSYLIVGTQSRS
jgi:hypothetical protein